MQQVPLHSQLAALLALPRSAPLSPPPSRERDAGDRKPDTFPVINGKNKSTRFVVCWVDKQTTNSSATSPLLGARRRSGGCCSISPAAVTLRWAPSQPVPSQLRGSLRGSRRSDRGVWKAYGKAGWRCVCMWGVGGYSSTGNLPRSKRLFLDYSPGFCPDQSRRGAGKASANSRVPLSVWL